MYSFFLYPVLFIPRQFIHSFIHSSAIPLRILPKRSKKVKLYKQTLDGNPQQVNYLDPSSTTFCPIKHLRAHKQLIITPGSTHNRVLPEHVNNLPLRIELQLLRDLLKIPVQRKQEVLIVIQITIKICRTTRLHFI